jgi:hypothetical protein
MNNNNNNNMVLSTVKTGMQRSNGNAEKKEYNKIDIAENLISKQLYFARSDPTNYLI